MSIIDELAVKAVNDEYFIKLYRKIEKIYFEKFIKKNDFMELTEKEISNVLRFSEILCRSENYEYKNRAFKIVSILYELYGDKEEIRIIINSILVKLGNFPAIKMIEKEKNIYENSEIKLEKVLKQTYQNTPDEKHIFTDSQYKVFKSIIASNHYSFSGPTSFGKSFIMEEFIQYIIKKRNGVDNIAILVPTRALINQVRIQLKENTINTNYKIITYPEIPSMYIDNSNKYIFIFTPERLIAYLCKKNEFTPNIDYMFIDEAQKIISSKDSRSPLYYHAILLAQRKSIKLYFASPNIANADIFLQLFEKSREESTVIKEVSVSQNRLYIDLIEKKCIGFSDLGGMIQLSGTGLEEKENLYQVIKELGSESKNIVYCNSVKDTVNHAFEFAKILDETQDEEINNLIKLIKETIHDEYFLIDCLKRKVAFHFGRLPQRIREEIERLFKKGIIKHVFCTSTLLEGVNLPAKNVFILSNSIGQSKLTDIDFWNLAGRAGRLKYEMIGNVICIRSNNKKNSWRGLDEDAKLINNLNIKEAKSEIIEGNNNFYKNLENAIENQEFTNKSASQEQKDIWKHYSNLVFIHTNTGNQSVLVNNFLNKNKNSQKIINECQKENIIPSSILEQSSNISPIYQNKILKMIDEDYIFPKEVTKENCRKVLEKLYDYYNWGVEESKGRRPLVKNRKKLVYLSHLMYDWISSMPLKNIITATIKHYSQKKCIYLYNRMEKFDKSNRYQVNEIINRIIGDIDTDLRFKIKNYMTNYYLLMCEKYGEEEAGEDWSEYLEYGTTNRKNIELQNIGIPIYIAKIILEEYSQFVVFEDETLIELKTKELLANFNKEKYKNEYFELEEIIGD